jgi:hypothetical protein
MTRVRMTCDHREHRGQVVTLDQANSTWRGCTFDRMVEPAAFSVKNECAKCGEFSFSWRFIPRGFHMEHAGGHWCAAEGDHLDLTCQRCGFQFNMATKDEGGA